MPRRFHVDRSLDPTAASVVDAALRAAGCEPAESDADLVWTVMPTRAASATTRVSLLPGLDTLLHRRALADLHHTATTRLHTCTPDVAPLVYPTTLSLPDERARGVLDAAYAPHERWIRRPRVHGTNLRPEPLNAGAQASADGRWDAQRRITSPLLIDGHVWTLRFATLVDSVLPLRAAVWAEPRVMVATAPYDASATGAAFLDACVTSEPNPHIDWRAALTQVGLSPDTLLSSAHDTIAALLAVVRDQVRDAHDALVAFGATPGHPFELLEFDVMVDSAGTAHLLECARWPHVKPPRASDVSRLDDWSANLVRAVVARLDAADTAPGFVPLFPSPRIERLALLADAHADEVSAALSVREQTNVRFVPQQVSHYFLDDAVVVFPERTGHVSVLNASASYAWMRVADGSGLDSLIAEMVMLFRIRPDVAAHDVWTAVADWIRNGLVGRRPATALPVPDVSTAHAWGWNTNERIYQHLGWPVLVRWPGEDDHGWLATTLLAHASDAQEARSTIEVLRDGDAYALLVDGATRVGPLTPRDTPAAVHTWLRRLALAGRNGVLGLSARLVHGADAAARAVLLVQSGPGPDASVPGTPTRLLLDGRPLVCRREHTPDTTLELAAIVQIEWAPGPAALTPLRRADALRALLADDPHALTAFTAEGVGALVGFMRDHACYVLTAANAEDARTALAAMHASL